MNAFHVWAASNEGQIVLTSCGAVVGMLAGVVVAEAVLRLRDWWRDR